MNKDDLPQGNHYHTSLLLTTHCTEDWMLYDAYNPERRRLERGAFRLNVRRFIWTSETSCGQTRAARA